MDEDLKIVNQMALGFASQGKFEDAIASFKKSLEIMPNGETYYLLGMTYQRLKRYNEAEKSFRQALVMNPNMSQPYNGLGMIDFENKLYQSAIKWYRLALKNNPYDFAAYNNLGNANKKIGKSKLAIKYYLKALKIVPNRAEPYANLGTVYFEDGNLDKSEKYLLKALKINPNYITAKANIEVLYRRRGDSYRFKGQDKKAVDYYKKLLELNPNSIDSYYGLGLIFDKNHNIVKAQKSYKKALVINPNSAEVLSALVSNLMQSCDFDELQDYGKKFDNLSYKDQPALLSVARTMDEASNLKVAQAKALEMEKVALPNMFKSYNKHSLPLRGKKISNTRPFKIKIGYLSCDFYNHATSHLIQGIFSGHNRSNFEVFTYSYGIDDKSSYRKKIEKDSDHFADVKDLSNIEVVEKIHKDKIDILIDLKGYTKDSRFDIMAYRPAPIQITWLGFPGTTGAKFIDYIITDKIVTPNMKYYTEKPIFMPCYQINDDEQKISNKKYKRSNFGLPEKHIVFASFNATYKISKETFSSWMNIIRKVPDGVLWIYAPDNETQINLQREALKNGIASKRLVFTSNLPKDEHLSRIGLSDIALDTFTYNGHTTTSDCLWAGVPVITLKGNHFASRVSASLLTAVGLPELITNSQKEYEKLAISLATNPKKLDTIHKSLFLNRKSCVLFNTKLFVENLEKEYVKIWKIYNNEKI